MAKKNRRLNEPVEQGTQVSSQLHSDIFFIFYLLINQLYIVIAPDGGYGWVVMLASFVCNFLIDGCVFSYGVFTTVFQKELGFTLTEISLIPSTMFGVYCLLGPIFSALVNRFGFRWVGFSGGIIAASGKSCVCVCLWMRRPLLSGF